jgi:probable HAF family extracellular repeat protein
MRPRWPFLREAFLSLTLVTSLASGAAERYTVTALPFFNTRGAALSNAGVVAAGMVNPDGSVSLGQWSNGTLTKLGAAPGLPREFNKVRPFGINDSGAIVGTIYTSAGELPARTFIYSGGRFTVLPLVKPTHLGGTAIGINSSGAVVGYDTTATHREEGWLWSNGAYSSLPVSGDDTVAFGINSSGTIVGNRTINTIQRLLTGCCEGARGYVVRHGTTEYLDGFVNAINDRGEAAGASSSAHDARATVFRNGVATAILSLPSSAVGINSAGDVVGSYQPSGSTSHVFLRKANSGAVDLTPEGYRYAMAAAINNRDEVLGFGETASGGFQYFLLRPDPNGALVPKRLPSVLVTR